MLSLKFTRTFRTDLTARYFIIIFSFLCNLRQSNVSAFISFGVNDGFLLIVEQLSSLIRAKPDIISNIIQNN